MTESKTTPNVVVAAFEKVLATHAPAPGFVADVGELPYPKNEIKVAILTLLSVTDDLRLRDRLKWAYVSLADWQAEVGPTHQGLDMSEVSRLMSSIQDPVLSAQKIAALPWEGWQKWQPIVKAELDTSVGELRKRGFWPSTWKDQADAYEIVDKPFTKALSVLASKYQDETLKADISGLLWPLINLRRENFDEFVTGCAITVVCQITVDAIKNIRPDAGFQNPVPKYTPMIVAYSLCLLTGVRGQLSAEGVEIGWRDMAITAAGVFFFMGHTADERVKHAMEGMDAFQTLVKEITSRENVREWNDNLMQLVYFYVLQLTTKDKAMEQRDYIPLFGSMLSSLLKTVE